jgi:tryptophan 2,3-dioxygenase
MDELPKKVLRIDVIKVEYGRRKLCECMNPHYEIDYQNRTVTCVDCGAIVEPFEALYRFAQNCLNLNEQVESILEQRQQLLNWKPRLVLMRQFAEQYASGHGRNSMVPCCPNCGKPFDLPIANWANRTFLKKKDDTNGINR